MVTAGGFDGGGPRPGPGRGPPWLVANRGTGASGARAVPAATGGCRRSDVPAQHPETAPGTRGRARVVGPAFLTAGAPRDSGRGVCHSGVLGEPGCRGGSHGSCRDRGRGR